MDQVAKSSQEVTIVLASIKPLMMALGGFFPAFAIGKIGAAAMEAIGRNPEASGKLFIPMILGMALAESIAIYTLIVVLIS
jgi:F-type H+-transporting ATPase subunit c